MRLLVEKGDATRHKKITEMIGIIMICDTTIVNEYLINMITNYMLIFNLEKQDLLGQYTFKFEWPDQDGAELAM